jgi:hypothetical protein
MTARESAHRTPGTARELTGFELRAVEDIASVGGPTLHSIWHIARIQRVADNDEGYDAPEDMLAEHRAWFLYEITH